MTPLPLAGGERPAATWRAEYPEDFSRWARAVTDRRVGVALGGGARAGLLNGLTAAATGLDEIARRRSTTGGSDVGRPGATSNAGISVETYPRALTSAV